MRTLVTKTYLWALAAVACAGGCATQSPPSDREPERQQSADRAPESTSSTESSDTSTAQSPSYSEARPEGVLETCPDADEPSGSSCRRTTLEGTRLEIILTVGLDTDISGEGTMPSELVRYRFLGQTRRYHRCALEAAKAGWRGEGTAMIQLEISGSEVTQTVTDSEQLPETFTTCATEMSRRLRFTRAPDGEIRVVQPLHVSIEPIDS